VPLLKKQRLTRRRIVMQAFQERVVAEKADLDKKLEALRKFQTSEAFWELPLSERRRLGEQAVAMGTYSTILEERIMAFGEPKSDGPNAQIMEARLKETLAVLHDIVDVLEMSKQYDKRYRLQHDLDFDAVLCAVNAARIMRHEPTIQSPRFTDLEFRASTVLARHGFQILAKPEVMKPCEQCKSDFPYAPLVHGRHICKSCAAKMDTPKPDLHRLHRDDNSFVGDMEGFEKGLTDLINRHSIENVVDMPDYLLSEMICRMINAMGPGIKKTLDWHKCDSTCHPSPETNLRFKALKAIALKSEPSKATKPPSLRPQMIKEGAAEKRRVTAESEDE
jgi:hypothetical protein